MIANIVLFSRDPRRHSLAAPELRSAVAAGPSFLFQFSEGDSK
jgi:hypothetical protein